VSGAIPIPRHERAWVQWADARDAARARRIAAFVTVVGVAILSLARYLTPFDAGFGTHTQLGLPPCMTARFTGYPCPTCGMTTAFSHTLRGHFWTSLRVQPAGFVLSIATILATLAAISTLATGKVWRINWQRLRPEHVACAGVALILGAWVYKIIVMRTG